MVTVGGNRQEKRKRIMSYFINATIELMEKEGIENLTIRKVAEQAKYNSATLYHYFSNLDELELFASVKCLDEYMQETLIHKAEGKDFQEWYLGQWRCFCRHSFQRPRIYNFLFFSPEGTQNLNEVFLRVMFVDSLRCISCLKRRSKSVRIILSETGTEVKENL